MTIAALATTAAVAPIGWHASQRPHAPSVRPCAPARPYEPRMLADRVPAVMDAQLTPTLDGGMLIAFASYRGSRKFPDSRFTVLHVDSGCRDGVRTGIGSPTCCGSMTVKLTRRAGDSRWTRQVIDRSGGSVPATATLRDGRMAVGYRDRLPRSCPGAQPGSTESRGGSPP
jgi:hypothetical protein